MNQSVFTNSEIRGIRRWFGAAIAVLAVTILLMNIEVTSFGFFRIGPLNSAPILVITLVLFIIWAVISSKKFPWIMVAINIRNDNLERILPDYCHHLLVQPLIHSWHYMKSATSRDISILVMTTPPVRC